MGALDSSKVAAAPIRAEVVVVEGRYMDRGLQTASWYDVHQLQAGVYPMRSTDVSWAPTPAATRPYFVSVTVPTVLVEQYRVSRLFHASSSSTTQPDTAATVTFTVYGYQLKDGLVLVADDRTGEPLATVRLLADHPDRHRFAVRNAADGRLMFSDEKCAEVRAACLCGWQSDQVTDRDGARRVHTDVHQRDVADRYGCNADGAGF